MQHTQLVLVLEAKRKVVGEREASPPGHGATGAWSAEPGPQAAPLHPKHMLQGK